MVSRSECELKKRRSKGKQNIEIKKVEKKESRHVVFSKRRKGLFKKCNDLCSAYHDSQYAGLRCEWWDTPIDGLGLEELERFKTRLEGLRDGVVSRVNRV
ncbi:hypothetical protein vseg_007708 [Gypsophila vaccaria]